MVDGVVYRTMRTAIERMYEGRCTVFVQSGYVNPVTKRTEFVETVLYADQSCRLSFSNGRNTTGGAPVAEMSQGVTLFIAPELDIPVGSKIEVTQNGDTTAYSRSGTPSRYVTHQEIKLSPFERWV